MDETWLPIVGYEGLYEVSSLGRCRSIDRMVGRSGRYGSETIKRKGVMLKPSQLAGGYLSVELCKEGVRKRLLLHRLVAQAFHGECPPGHECGHLDNDRAHNAEDNLRWITRKENQGHRLAAGTANKGESAHQAKLSWSEVCDIRAKLAAGRTTVALGIEYGVSQGAIWCIKSGKTWKEQYPKRGGRTVYLPGLVA